MTAQGTGRAKIHTEDIALVSSSSNDFNNASSNDPFHNFLVWVLFRIGRDSFFPRCAIDIRGGEISSISDKARLFTLFNLKCNFSER